MDSKSGSRWYRPHLLTPIITAIVSSGLLWLNIAKYREGTYSQSLRGYTRGWPFVMEAVSGWQLFDKSFPLQPGMLVLNTLISLCIIVAVTISTRYIIRRHEQSNLPWFRFRLLTAIGMMFLASGIIWINLQEHRIIPEWADNEPARVFGWPVTAVTFYSAYAMMTTNDVPEISYSGLLLDGICAMVILFMLAGISEFLIRRREARKT